MKFTSIKSDSELKEWLSPEVVREPELQESLQHIADHKENWKPEFLNFLGITDERVLKLCAYDHEIALLNKEAHNMQVESFSCNNSQIFTQIQMQLHSTSQVMQIPNFGFSAPQ